ncbi:MAG: tetratricopeptide repeat protein, partial [Nitrospinota bacterium]
MRVVVALAVASLLLLGSVASAQEGSSPSVPEGERELFHLAQELFRRGAYGRSLPFLRAYLERFPEGKGAEEASYMLADGHYFIAQSGVPEAFTKAVDAYKRALLRFPSSSHSPRAYLYQGRSYQALGLHAEALASFRSLLERAPQSAHAPAAQLEVGHYYFTIGDWNQAILEYERVLDRHPRSPAAADAFFGIAGAYFKKGHYRRARLRYEQGKKRWPHYLKLRPRALFHYGETLYQLHEARAAERVFLELINVYPSEEFIHRALARLGDIYRDAGKIREALKIYSETVSSFGDKEGALVSRIRMAELGSKEKLADLSDFIFDMSAYLDPLSAYSYVARAKPDSPLAQIASFKSALLKLQRGRAAEAVELLKGFVKRYPQSPLIENAQEALAKAYIKRVEERFLREDYLGATRAYEDYLAAVPGVRDARLRFEALLQVAESYIRLGFHRRALPYLEEVLSSPRGRLHFAERAIALLVGAHLLTGESKKAALLAETFLKR